jgi:nitrite reductase/ring-hydroxylating ferredoxin subunit
MLSVSYRKLVPYPFDVVLGQYYDHEHIAHVHPNTLGEYRLVSVEGDRVVYDQIWPGRRARSSRVEQRLVAANEIWFEFVAGRYRGTRVRSLLEPRGDATLVDETYFLPGLPDWRWLRRLVLPSIARRVDRIWDEDLSVEVCRGGWPGLPESLGASPPPAAPEPAPADDGARWVDAIALSAIPPSGGARVEVDGREIALFEDDGQLYALDNACPHSGGPLALGRCADGTVACPWHGARFALATGRVVDGPAEHGVACHAVRRAGDRVEASRAFRTSAASSSTAANPLSSMP